MTQGRRLKQLVTKVVRVVTKLVKTVIRLKRHNVTTLAVYKYLNK